MGHASTQNVAIQLSVSGYEDNSHYVYMSLQLHHNMRTMEVAVTSISTDFMGACSVPMF